MRIPKRLLPRLLLVTSLAICSQMVAAQVPQSPAATDPLESALAGEFALQGGRLADAARDYLQAAQRLQDPVLAERATRIALLADADPLAETALALWRKLAPQAGESDQQMVTATLALRSGRRFRAWRELDALLAAPDGWRKALVALTGAVGKQQPLVAKMLGKVIAHGPVPDQLQGWLAMGGLAQRLEQPALVDQVVKQVVARFPDDPRVALLRAQWLRESGDLAQARQALASLRDPAQLTPGLRAALAGEYEALGDLQEAAQVLAIGPQDDGNIARRAALLSQAKDMRGLEQLYAELRPSATEPNPMRRLLLGQLAEELKHYDDALAWYLSVPGERGQGIAKLRSANVRWLKGEKQQAYAALRAIQADAALEDDVRRDGYMLEAELYGKDADHEAERGAYARGLAAFPDSQDLLYARALMWERQDEIAKAEADFRRILVISPDSVVTLNALGYTLADRTTRYREALELIDRARVADPGNAAIIDSYGWVLFKLGKPREALAHLRHAFALQKDPDIASHLGQVLWVLGQKDEARRYFDEARRLDPDSRSLRRALQETGA